MRICELAIFSEDNFLRQATTWADSVHQYYPTIAAITEGSEDGFYNFYNSLEYEGTDLKLMMDLGHTFTAKALYIVGREDCCHYEQATLEVRFGNGG